MRFSLLRQFCISLWNVAGALHSPMGMQSHSKNPKLLMVKAVYCLDASSILICQNPDFRSRQEKWPAPTRLLDSWQGIRVLPHVGIETAEVDAEA